MQGRPAELCEHREGGLPGRVAFGLPDQDGWPWVAEAAGLPKINLHDVRHSYASAARDGRIDWKALSERIGHADVAFTMRQYVRTNLEVHRQVATALAKQIFGGTAPAPQSLPSARQRASAGG